MANDPRNAAQSKKQKAAEARAKRSAAVGKRLGKELEDVFGKLGDFVVKGAETGATAWEKGMGSMAAKLQKNFKELEEAAVSVGTEGFKSATAHYQTLLETSEVERRRLDISLANGDMTQEQFDLKRDQLDTEIQTFGVLKAKSVVLDKQNELIMAGTEGLNTMKQQYLDMWGTIKAMATSWAGVAGGTVLLNKYLGETSKTLGLSVGQTAGIVHQNALLGPAFKMFGLDVASTQKALIDNFQNMNDVTLSNVANMGLLQLQTGLTAEEAGKASRMFSLIEGSTAAAGMNMTKQVATQAELAGAVPAKVIADMTANSDKIAEYWAGNVESLTEAAIQASKLGLSMSDISTAAAGLLNIESSIAAEMEAEILLGKQLNLEKAREAALMGDSATLMQELIKNAGSLEEFNSMNVLQRQKLAAALGIGVGELQKMVQEQDQLSTSSGKMAAAWSKYSHAAITGAPAAIKMISQLKSLGAGKLLSKIGGLFSGIGGSKGSDVTPDVAPPDTTEKMTKVGSGTGKAATSMLKGAAAMLIMGAALWVAAKGFQELAKVDWGALWPGAVIALVALAGVMALFGVGPVAAFLLTGALVFASMSVALLLFGVAMMAVGKGVELTRNGLQGFGAVIGELIPMIPGMFALGAAFGIMGIGLISLSAGLIALVPALPVIMALGAMATLALAMSGAGGGAEGEVMEMKSTSIEDKLDALTAAILAQPIIVEMDGKVVGRAIGMSKTQTTIDMA